MFSKELSIFLSLLCENLILERPWQHTLWPFRNWKFVTAALVLKSLPTPDLGYSLLSLSLEMQCFSGLSKREMDVKEMLVIC